MAEQSKTTFIIGPPSYGFKGSSGDACQSLSNVLG